LHTLPHSDFGYPQSQGSLVLREALARYLGRVRGLRTSPDRLLICNGFSQGLTLLCLVLRDRGARRIAIEDPCFAFHRDVIEHAGLQAVPVPVDAEGIEVDRLALEGVGAVLVAPAHSYPTGAVLSAERRCALVRWARDNDALVIEDDYDAEFRYDRAPVGALQGLDSERVAYGGSGSKVLSPLLRLGWLALPAALVDDVVDAKLHLDLAAPGLEQLALAGFLDSGDLTRHLRRIRPLYRRRRDATLAAIARHLPGARAEGVDAGLHLYVRLPPGVDERTAVGIARWNGVRVEGSARHWASPEQAPPALVLGYGTLPEVTIERGLAVFGEALRENLPELVPISEQTVALDADHLRADPQRR
jgi:GntR family transcriptional regulator/MocR family aminotransferase